MYYIFLVNAGSSWIESEKLFRNTKKLFKYVLQECNPMAALLVSLPSWISILIQESILLRQTKHINPQDKLYPKETKK